MPAMTPGSAIAILACISLARCGCGERVAHEEDASTDDAATDPDVATDPDIEAWDTASDNPADSVDTIHDPPPPDGPVLPPLEDIPACGNRVLEEGEECDDGNRLNSDGCDWSCHLGDGDPIPDPDPDVVDYVPSGDPIALPGSVHHTSPSSERMPLVWTGSEYATAWPVLPEGSEPPTIEFRRFDTSGATLDAPWVYASPAYFGGMDLVWIGGGFGLFYVDMAAGLYYMRLDEDGKPLSAPLLVEPDARVRAPAADLAPEGLVVAWIREMGTAEGWSWCCEDLDRISLRLMQLDGTLVGPVVTVDETAQGPPDIATGDDGFGLVFTVDYRDESIITCMSRFVRLDLSLTTLASSGVLGTGAFQDVKWAGDRWVTASPYSRCTDPYTYSCTDYAVVAIFSPEGALAGPPLMNPLADFHYPDVARLAAGDGGLAIVMSGDSDQYLDFLRTDSSGVAVGPLHEVVPGGMWEGAHFGAFNTVWSNDAFGVLFHYGSMSAPDAVYLRHFVPAG